MFLNTVRFGKVRIVSKSTINPLFDDFVCGDDYDDNCVIWEYAFYRLNRNYGEIVAVYEGEE